MLNETGLRRILPDQLSGSGHSFGTPRHPSINDRILSKRVCFYKSGDPQFNGLRMVINNRSFKTFDALLDSLSKKVPLPFGVRNITTPHGIHAICTLDELEDGKSYICSDNRKVKPINLTLARKKLPPWYHARPVSSRRQTVQKARFFPGHRKELALVRTPKRLLIFRNGVPAVKHSVVIHKRTTPTFESILEYISELLQFHVVKLHTPDGRRVDSLPGLILCSGIVVAAGKEPFRPANYNAHKSPTATMLPSNRMGLRRLKAFTRHKKSLSYTSKTRPFSPSSERYIVNRIHDSIAESSCDLPCNLANSIELESGHMLGSVAETEGDAYLCDGAAGQEGLLPSEDDIEKSFRVNQDGSMTVEMRVRLTIKEEETIHWTTTLTRSSVANQINVASLPELEGEQEIDSLKSNSLELPSLAASIDSTDKDKTEDNDEDPPSLGGGAFTENSNEEDNIKIQSNAMSPGRAPTPGHKQKSEESIKSLMEEGVQEGMIGSYSYREQTEHGAMTEQYCMVKQSSSKPVPKPRRLGSMDSNNVKSRNLSTFKSAEILQIESSGDDITETVLHIYEQQTCQDNYLANLCAQGMSATGIPFCRPATSGTGQLSSSNEFEPDLWRPSTASDSISIWRAESMSLTSDLMLKPGANAQQGFTNTAKGKNNPLQSQVNKDKMVPSKHKVINKRVRRLMSPGKRQKENSTEETRKQKKMKSFSSAGFIKRIYGNKSKSKNMTKPKTQNGDVGLAAKSSQQLDQNIPSAFKENTNEMVSLEKRMQNDAPNKANQSRGTLTRQTSVHQEKKKANESYVVSEIMSLSPFNSSTSDTNKYVENWLETAHLNTTAYQDVESKKLAHHGRRVESENKNGSECSEETSDVQMYQTPKNKPLAEDVQGASVKQRIQSFENKSSSPSMKKPIVNQQIIHSQRTPTTTDDSLDQNNAEEIKSAANYYCSKATPPLKTTIEMSLDSENESRPIKISLQNATPSSTLSMELPFPPPPENIELSNAEYCMIDASSVASSPLYMASSVSSHMSNNHPSSISPTSDKAISPTDHTIEMTASFQTDIPSSWAEDTSIKKAPLVSNRSLDKKMSLRKAHLDKYTLCSDATSETSSSSTPIVGDNVLPNSICSAGKPLQCGISSEENSIVDVRSSPSCFSTCPTSLTSEERTTSATISSSEATTPSDAPFTDTKMDKTLLLTQKEALSPKPLVKKVKLMSSPSPDRKSQTKKFASDLPQNSPKLSSLHNHPPDKMVSPNTGRRKQATNKSQKRESPYSQSMDIVSPPVRHKSNRKLLSRNLSSDNSSDLTDKTQRKTPSERRHQQRQSIKSTADLDQTLTSDGDKSDDLMTERSMAETQRTPQPFNTTNQLNIKPVLEDICYSIKSIRQITQNKHPSCVEKSNSLPDFSAHVASTFGSSSKTLLAFLSIMTLKDAITNPNMDELNANNVSCAEAFKMIDSLREIASIEDSHRLKVSLSNLQRSTSRQLLQSWRGFQELSDKCKRCSLTSNDSKQETRTKASPERDCSIDEKIIDKIMDNLDMPEKLKEELASLSVTVRSDSDDNEKMMSNFTMSHFSTEDVGNISDVTEDQEKASMNEEVGCEKGLEQDNSCSSEVEEKNVEDNELQMDREESVSIPDDELCSEQEEQNVSSANRDLEQRVSCQLTVSGSEDEPEVECEGMQQENRESDDLHNPESHSEEEEDKTPSYYVEGRLSGCSSSNQQEVECLKKDALPKPSNLSKSQQQSQTGCKGLNARVDESTCNSHVNEPCSQKEQPKVEWSPMKVIIEESLSDNEEADESMGEEERLDERPRGQTKKYKTLQTLKEETEEVSSNDGDHHNDATQICEDDDLCNLIENQDSYTKKDKGGLIKSDHLEKPYRFSADEDSGNDHMSCEEHVEAEQPNVVVVQISSSLEEELSYYEKESTSDEEHANVDRYIEDSRAHYQEASSLETHSEVQRVEGRVKHPHDGKISKSIAERVFLLEKRVADSQKRQNTTPRSPRRHISQTNAALESDGEDSELPTSDSAPQSSLSFSYDSSGVITTEPEANRVKSIREMFLARSAADIRQGQRRFPSPNTSERSELRADTSVSGGYQSQTSSDVSSGEDGSPRKSITKGFVRRTIERLYGKKDVSPDEEVSERPPSAPKQNKKEHSSIFSPFHTSRCKTVSELSYFSSTNTLDTFGEATRCLAFNAQVGPGDSVPIDDGRWLLRENALIRKSVSDPVGINKGVTNSPQGEEMCEDIEENTTHSLSSTKSEPEDKSKSFSGKCTYFSLPHASDSDICQDDQSTPSKSSMNADMDKKDNSEDTKMWADRNGTLPGVGITDFKKLDNKVHPLTEPPPDGEVVVVQPRKGQGVANRRLQEPDMLDLLYNFCGQNCPIL